MRFDDVCVPLSAAWSSPFVRWQGPAAEINSLDLAHQVTERALAQRGVQWPFHELVLGSTIPQLHSFYAVPTLASRLGLGSIAGPLIAQACATSVACLHVAAASQNGSPMGARLVVASDRTSNGPHLVYPSAASSGGTPRSDLQECEQALLDAATDGPPGMMVWLDAPGGGLAVQVSLAHVEKACEAPVVIPAAALRTEGARAALLKAFDAKQRQ